MNKNTFQDLALSEVTLNTIKTIGFTTPTPVQAAVIPLALEGKDILASAQTGSGKTCAFALPIIEHLTQNPKSTALIVAPTRELALQVHKVFTELTVKHPKLSSAFLVGGQSVTNQQRNLKKNPRCVIGTPGRINDLLKRGSLSFANTEVVVWDEMDRMLDIGFLYQIKEIVARLPAQKQTMMFSATFPKRVAKLAEEFLVNPKRVTIGEENAVAAGVKEEHFEILRDEKFEKLQDILRSRGGSTLIFARTQRNVEWMAKALEKLGFNAIPLHGGLTQGKRTKAVKDFREEKFDIMVATDVAARGIDIPHIQLVINYDLPLHAEDYIHRIGRTARAERTGTAISFISKGEKHLWDDIQKFLAGKDVAQRPVGKDYKEFKKKEKRAEKPKSFAQKRTEAKRTARKNAGKSSRTASRAEFKAQQKRDKKFAPKQREEKEEVFTSKKEFKNFEQKERGAKKSGFEKFDKKRGFEREDNFEKKDNFKRGGKFEKRAPRGGGKPAYKGRSGGRQERDGDKKYGAKTGKPFKGGKNAKFKTRDAKKSKFKKFTQKLKKFIKGR
ncbi:superfamily II DNA/RNA helicase [Elusimicrobium simillimum]|uniref:DEAD/DEAH box helicase n=1 Tax=Elusimicrobium simillimum TaxID=3143438 RepID=UPI003C6EEFE2